MSSLIKLYQIEGGPALKYKVKSIENMLENGDFTVNEMNAKNGVIQNNLMVGYTDNTTDLCDNLVMEVSGSTLFHNQVQILGDTIFGEKSSNAEDVSNNDTNLFVYGDLRIMDGGNIIIEDVCNTTITDLRTEVRITDSLDISNDGTSVAMTVRQIETATHDIAHFVDGNDVVFTIGAGGKTYIGGDVSMDSSLEISNNLIVHANLLVDEDASFGSHLQVVGDVSMESSLEISNNLIVHNEMIVDKDASFGSHLQVVSDVSMESSLEISNNLIVHNEMFVDKDVSFGGHLQVVSDVSMESSLEISNNLHVNGNIIYSGILYEGGEDLMSKFDNSINAIQETLQNITGGVDGNVSFGGHLHVVGDVSMESSLEISNNLLVHANLSVDEDASFGSHLYVVGKVNCYNNFLIHNGSNIIAKSTDTKIFANKYRSIDNSTSIIFENNNGENILELDSSNLDTTVKNNLHVHTSLLVDGDVSFGGHLQVVGDVSMESSLEISNNLIVHTNLLVNEDASFGSHLHVVGDVSMESSLEISNNLLVHTNLLVDEDASFGSHLHVVGDVSMESSLEISNNLLVNTQIIANTYKSIGDLTSIIFDNDTGKIIFQNKSGNSILELDKDLDTTVKNDLKVDGEIYTAGGIGIGKAKEPAYELDVSGDIHCTGTLFADSDLKVKKNLVPLDNSLDKLSNLNGYYYNKVGEEEDSLKHIGVIAQEVEAEYPELVSQNTHIKSVNYDGINAILIECVKELRKENLAIKSELEELKNKFEKM